MQTAPPGWGIWVMSRNGTNARQVTRDAQTVAANDTYPAFSPDGAKILFVRDPDLYVMNADGTGVTNLTSTFARAVIDPEWSPLGDLIAFSDGGDIYVIGASGTPAPRLLTTTPGNQRYPSWAPDGSAIAYADIGAVGRINPDGTNDVVLASGLREVWDLAWSPDGTRIAFVNDPGDNIAVQEELYVMNADGTGAHARRRRHEHQPRLGGLRPRRARGSRPVVGETVTAGVASGKVFIKKGTSFVPLTEDRSIPVGSTLDTRQGTVELSSARDAAGRTQTGKFSAGVFQVLQSRSAKAKGLTELRLKGSAAKFRRCRSTSAAPRPRPLPARDPAPARQRARPLPHRGRHSAATVRGTVWDVIDRCDGTLTKVRRGKVAVRDFRRKRTIVVARGEAVPGASAALGRDWDPPRRVTGRACMANRETAGRSRTPPSNSDMPDELEEAVRSDAGERPVEGETGDDAGSDGERVSKPGDGTGDRRRGQRARGAVRLNVPGRFRALGCRIWLIIAWWGLDSQLVAHSWARSAYCSCSPGRSRLPRRPRRGAS